MYESKTTQIFIDNIIRFEFVPRITKWKLTIESDADGNWFCCAYLKGDKPELGDTPFFKGEKAVYIHNAIEKFLIGLENKKV